LELSLNCQLATQKNIRAGLSLHQTIDCLSWALNCIKGCHHLCKLPLSVWPASLTTTAAHVGKSNFLATILPGFTPTASVATNNVAFLVFSLDQPAFGKLNATETLMFSQDIN